MVTIFIRHHVISVESFGVVLDEWDVYDSGLHVADDDTFDDDIFDTKEEAYANVEQRRTYYQSKHLEVVVKEEP